MIDEEKPGCVSIPHRPTRQVHAEAGRLACSLLSTAHRSWMEHGGTATGATFAAELISDRD